MSGENNPSKRPEVRKKLRDRWTPEMRQEKSEMWAGDNNPAKSEAVREKIIENHPSKTDGDWICLADLERRLNMKRRNTIEII